MSRALNVFIIVALAALSIVLARPVFGATPPSFSAISTSVQDTALLVPVEIDKSTKALSYSKVSVRTIDGTAKAGVDYTPINTTITFSNTALQRLISITLIARAGYQGNRAFTVHISAVRNAAISVADATVTIIETEAPLPTGTWVLAPFTKGGFARCKSVVGCHSIGVPYPDIIAQQGDVWLQAWNGIDRSGASTLALYPQGQWLVAGQGVEGWQDEWEGVVPA